jgi:hypothetical protein
VVATEPIKFVEPNRIADPDAAARGRAGNPDLCQGTLIYVDSRI